ncbi:SURF1 family protein [Yoonia sediminilitoris]|uniref:SURF1-like protein n=1 Tax=Yoonia sediminilitoris TaxID=1286148 RepID=A0A2T6KK00_9RHOB|nr:SURF1 family protein [Yoonia sediminilitoris]PUB16300.1 surfeit locus 1 family protein [Yoonia sediminilitoris]RCW96649.1 surfeit locus 1 family protein [Yoonia sediminilitoris]
MLRRILFPLLLGLSGCAVLVSLGTWQVQRLAWKESILADINARLSGEPAPLRLDARETTDEYTRVTLSGTPTGQELHVLVSGTQAGTGYRVISAFETSLGPTILLDQGLLPLDSKQSAPLTDPMQVTGTLLWPDDQNSNTPDPDLGKNIWFARNVATMSQHLGTQPLMVVTSTTTPTDPRLTPLPVTTANIKNDHLEYAITWFLLAAVWATMSLYLIYRTTRPKDV